MKYSLMYLFSLLENDMPVRAVAQEQDLFGIEEAQESFQYEEKDIEFILCYFSENFDPSALGKKARDLFELSVNAFDSIVHAWMSELPVETEIIAFERRVLAAEKTGDAQAGRLAAERAACDRTYADTITVMDAAYKAQFEAHRMMGLLRFFPDTDGVYVARCAPDCFILPALGEYFTARFGETAWAVIDEKRGMCLSRENGKQAKFTVFEEASAYGDAVGDAGISIGIASGIVYGGDEWENLWRHYHKTINNESRNNPNLQRQFMPRRYWKYLPEVSN